jgi:hypothetical protein
MQGMFASGFVTTLWPDWELATSTIGAAPTETGLAVNDGRGMGDAGILIECLRRASQVGIERSAAELQWRQRVKLPQPIQKTRRYASYRPTRANPLIPLSAALLCDIFLPLKLA